MINTNPNLASFKWSFLILVFAIAYDSSRCLSQSLDCNKIIVANNFALSGLPVLQPGLLSVVNTYDTIRALTEINVANEADAFPWISPDGLRLYYTSGANNNQMMFTQRPNTSSYFGTPVIVPVTIANPSSYWLSANELDLYICNDSVYYAHRNSVGSAFNTPVLISLLQPFGQIQSYRSASLDSTQNTIYVSAYNMGYLGIFEFGRSTATSFVYKRSLPAPSGYTPITGQLSKDALYFFCDASYTGSFPVSLYQLSRGTPADSFDVSTFQLIPGINNLNTYNIQPSMSDSLNWVAFVGSFQYS